MSIWDRTAPESEWARKATDEQIVEKYWQQASGRGTHESFGRSVRDMRKRIYLLLIRGLESSTESAKRPISDRGTDGQASKTTKA